MARDVRIDYPGATHHITARGHQKKPLFLDDRDREHFLELLGSVAKRYRWVITSYCLMTNHFHFVVQTPLPNLGDGMRHLNGAYAVWFNARHQRINALFGDRYGSVLVESSVYMRRLARYVVRNPVRAGMVERAEDYQWSSYRATAGLATAPNWLSLQPLEAYFGGPQSWRAQYIAFVNESAGVADDLWRCLRRRVFLTSEEFLRRNLKSMLEGHMITDVHPKLQRLASAPAAHKIVDAVANAFGISGAALRYRRGGAARLVVAWLAWYEGVHTLRKIAAVLRMRSTGHVSNMIRKAESALTRSPDLRVKVDKACALIA